MGFRVPFPEFIAFVIVDFIISALYSSALVSIGDNS